jgi:hypothetical protein
MFTGTRADPTLVAAMAARLTALAAFFSASLAARRPQHRRRPPQDQQACSQSPPLNHFAAWRRLGFQERNSDKTNGVFPWPWLSGAMSTSNNRCQSRVAQSLFSIRQFLFSVSLPERQMPRITFTCRSRTRNKKRQAKRFLLVM